jgi:hypothetical protein
MKIMTRTPYAFAFAICCLIGAAPAGAPAGDGGQLGGAIAEFVVANRILADQGRHRRRLPAT